MTIRKTLFLSIITLIIFYTSFILLANDCMKLFSVTITITAILFFYIAYKTITKSNPNKIYNQKLKKTLNKYESILVYSKEKYDLKKEKIIKIKDIDNLVKAQRIINKPIIYLTQDSKDVFILKDKEYLLVFNFKI